MEKLRDQIAKDQAEPDVVRVTETRKDNSIVIGGLDYGYYVTDEVSNVDGTHASSSLCIVTTANPDDGYECEVRLSKCDEKDTGR